jgi:hypothetical protein
MLHPKSGVIQLQLEPETKYSFTSKTFADIDQGEEISSEPFELITPKNTYFGIQKKQSVSLFADSNQPDFELVSYDTQKK